MLNEVEILRGDHLATLKREIEARVSLLKSSEQAQVCKYLLRYNSYESIEKLYYIQLKIENKGFTTKCR